MNQYAQWKVIDRLGEGGNGVVWKVQHAQSGQVAALKVLKDGKPKRLKRFAAEIETMKAHSANQGVVSIIDSGSESNSGKNLPWFVMPIGVPIWKVGLDFSQTISTFKKLADTLFGLHNMGYTHRDIKPSNIYLVSGKWQLGDWGLVKFPGRKDLTSNGETIGPMFTMAPEMRRYARKADGRPADVYSLAKSLWQVIMKDVQGFDGQYVVSGSHSIRRLHAKQNCIHLLEELLVSSTDGDPNARPSAQEFAKRLEYWLEVSSNFHKSCLLNWNYLVRLISGEKRPQRCVCSDTMEIINILEIIGSVRNSNHMFLPDGGGQDLIGCSESWEAGCIELKDSPRSAYVAKVNQLILESFDRHTHTCYFILEVGDLSPSGVYERLSGELEEVTEIHRGQYDNRSVWDHDDNIPEDARIITRVLKGNLVIFSKRSIYNLTNETYDGRHASMSTLEFRSYIKRNLAGTTDEEALNI